MANSYFQFKQFLIRQDRCAMKVSTDAVLLGAVAGTSHNATLLDVGTGTGVISLMLAQRFPKAKIHAVELDREAYFQACENVEISPWKNRMKVIHQAFQYFSQCKEIKYDLIVSNPPYFPNHIKTNNSQRNLALHNDSLTFQELVQGVASLLSSQGEFWVILPVRQMQDLEAFASQYQLFIKSTIKVRDTPKSPIIRNICSFSRKNGSTIPVENFVLKNEDGIYTNQYRELLENFMLHF